MVMDEQAGLDDLRLWELGEPQHPVDRALLLIARANAEAGGAPVPPNATLLFEISLVKLVSPE